MKIKDLEIFFNVLRGIGIKNPESLKISDFRELNKIRIERLEREIKQAEEEELLEKDLDIDSILSSYRKYECIKRELKNLKGE